MDGGAVIFLERQTLSTASQDESLKVTILGAGTYGTALAAAWADHLNVHLWDRDRDRVRKMRDGRQSVRYLQDLPLPRRLSLEEDLDQALAQCDLVVFAVPTQAMRQFARQVAPKVPETARVVSGAKGLEQGSHIRPSKILRQELGAERPIFALGGPGHAEEIALGKPTTLVLAGRPRAHPAELLPVLSTNRLRFYANVDMKGVEWAAALKNIMAIAAGMAHGLGLGDNALSALITRGLAEMMRFGESRGAHHATFVGLSGLGDLMATCNSAHSRNRRVGELLVQNLSAEECMAQIGQVTEGVWTTQVAYDLAEALEIDMPITEQVYRVLFEGAKPMEALELLMTRNQKQEERWGEARRRRL